MADAVEQVRGPKRARAGEGKQLLYGHALIGPETMMNAFNRPIAYGRVAKGQATVLCCA